jgi:hypothetical protein
MKIIPDYEPENYYDKVIKTGGTAKALTKFAQDITNLREHSHTPYGGASLKVRENIAAPCPLCPCSELLLTADF